MGAMIAKIGPRTHVAPAGKILVSSRYEKDRGEVALNRRRWLAACALAASPAWAQLGPRLALAATTPQSVIDPELETQFLALFPLRIVAFPGELVLLHIFEPRYKQLIGETAELGINFGIVTIVPGGASSVGTEMALDRILGTDDSGNIDVSTRGTRVFQLHSVERTVEGKLYSGGRVSYSKNDPSVDPEIQSAVVQLYNRRKYVSGSRDAITPPYPENLSFLIGHDVGFSQAQELQLLTMSVERDRQAYIFQHLLRTQ